MKKNFKDRLGFTTVNYILLAIGIILLIAGYSIMNNPSIEFGDSTISPILLTISYVVVIPLGFFYKKKG